MDDFDRIRKVLVEYGLETDGPHDWRCEYYRETRGPCDCLDSLTNDIIRALERGSNG